MKRIYFVLFLLLSLSVKAQFAPKVALSYDDADKIRIVQPNGERVSYYLPAILLRCGFEYRYRKISAYYDQKIWCEYVRGISFSPDQSSFELGISYNISDKIKVSVHHVCYHPLQTDGKIHDGIYGGREGITFSYGY